MEIDGQVTISLKTFSQLQDRAKQADELKKKMQDLQEEITDIIDQIDESEAEPIFREIDDNNMTDKQIQKRFDETISGDKEQAEDSVKTADVYNVAGYSIMLFMALAGIVFVIHEDKKKKNTID